MRVAVVLLLACCACGDNLRVPIDATSVDAPGCAACADLVSGGAAISCTRDSECPVSDRDNDGISDAAEAIGYLDFDCDGVETSADLPLPQADPDIPNIWLAIDYFERDLPASPRSCTTNADCVATATAAGHRSEQCFCQLAPDSCPTGETCDPRTRRCSGGATTGHFCTHSHKPSQAVLDLAIAPFQAPGQAGGWGSQAHAPIILAIHPDSDRIAERAVVSFGTAPRTACPSSGVCPSGTRCEPNTACEAVCPPGDPCRTLATACAGTDAVHFDDLKDAHFDPRHRWVYRYAIFGHYNSCPSASACFQCPDDPTTGDRPISTSTGIAELPGNDLIVSLGRAYFDPIATPPYLPEVVAGVLLHELGHTLNLHHGGHAETSRSPNYISVMNPAFQPVIFRGDVPGATACRCQSGPDSVGCCPRRVDYSHRVLPTLDETALDENVSIGDTADISSYYCYASNTLQRPAVAVSSASVDWNCNGTLESSVSEDINFDEPPVGGTGTTRHVGARDWPYACPASGTCDACGIPAALDSGDLSTETTCPLDASGVAASTGTLPCVNGQCQRFEYRFQCRDAGRSD